MMLSATPGWAQGRPPFAPGELVIGFDGEVAAAFQTEDSQTALELAQRILAKEPLRTGRILYGLSTQAGQNTRVATHWQLPASADVEATAARLAHLPGVAYAEPNYTLRMKSTPEDPGFTGDWEFGLQEHLITIGAPAAWDVTTGDPSAVVAVVDTGVDLDHPDLNESLVAGISYVSDTPQDRHGHGTMIAGIIAAEANNLEDLAEEAFEDSSWAGGVVGLAPGARVMPVRVLDSDGVGHIDDIVAGVLYAIDPDGDPGTDDGADIINLALGGEGFSQALSDAIAYAYDQGVLVIAAVDYISEGGISYPAADPYALGITAVDADDVWDGASRTGTLVDLSAQGVDVLTTAVDRDDPSEAGATGGAYGRQSGSSMSSAVVSGVAALVKSAHPDWGPSQIAGQLLATADSIDAMNPDLQNQLGAGRVDASSAIGPAAQPRVIALEGLGTVGGDTSTLPLLSVGDSVDVRFSHAMEPVSVLDPSQYQLTYLGDSADSSDDRAVQLSLITQPLPPDATVVSDGDNYYVSFPGRGVRLHLDGIAGFESTRLPSGEYRLAIGGIASTDSDLSATFTHVFQIAATPVPFGDRLSIDGSDPRLDTVAADLDGDGDLDVLCASGSNSPSGIIPEGYGYIAWHENTDGAGTFGPAQVITIEGEYVSSVQAVDLDNDGDLDVLSGLNRTLGPQGSFISKITWHENIDGVGTFGPRRVIAIVADGLRSPHAADLDGDGDLDVVSGFSDAGPGKIAWYENTDGSGSFGVQRVIATDTDGRVFSVCTADLDGDGDLDVLSGVSDAFGRKRVWYENIDGEGTFGPRQVIDTGYAVEIQAADLDTDGDLDVISISVGQNDTIGWHENTDGKGHFGPYQEIAANLRSVDVIHTADLDGDSDLDVLSGGQRDDLTYKIAWFENTDGDGSFGPLQVITTTIGSLADIDAADLDQDGDPDVLSASRASHGLAWYENTGGASMFSPQQEILPSLSKPQWIHAADLDGDGDLDAICASAEDNKLTWYENTGGIGTFGPQQVVTTEADFHTSGGSAFAADLDADGDLDLLSASPIDGKIAWYENLDGAGMFGLQRVITTSADGANDVYAADLDGDGDADVLSSSKGDNKIAWYENMDGKGGFGPQRVITSAAREAADVHAADLDQDGDLDVLSASSDNNTIAWYENLDGIGTFGPQLVITTKSWSAVSVDAADLDNDGDLDVISGDNGGVAWYENADGKGQFGPRQVLPSGPGWRSRRAMSADLDDDGDWDIVSSDRHYDSEQRLWSYRTVWYENTNGTGDFGLPLMIEDRWSSSSVFVGDLDGDQDLDVLAASNLGASSEIAWYENATSHPGDSNRDGLFNSSDLVQVFQKGEYEDSLEDNSTWGDGDWNGDGDFDSSDMVMAFQTGLYEIKSRTVTSKVAAAVDWLFAQEDPLRRRGRAFVA